MAFTKFTLAKKQPDKRCNAQVRVNGIEGYCDKEAGGKRCEAHNTSNIQKKRQERAKQAQVDSRNLDGLIRRRLDAALEKMLHNKFGNDARSLM